MQTKNKELLAKKTPVRVGVVDNPIYLSKAGPKLIAYYGGGHTVLTVGCNKDADRFMYIDPWGWGSKMKYEGGIKGDSYDDPCQYLGMFAVVYEEERLLDARDKGKPNLLRQTPEMEGTFNTTSGNSLEIVSGP